MLEHLWRVLGFYIGLFSNYPSHSAHNNWLPFSCGYVFLQHRRIKISLLWYDIAMYAQHREEFERGTYSSDRLTNRDSSNSDDVGQNEVDIARVRQMQIAIASLINVVM